MAVGLGDVRQREVYDLTSEERVDLLKRMYADPEFFARTICRQLVYNAPADVHPLIFEKLRSRPKNFAAILPRGWAKTTLVSTIGCAYDEAFEQENFTIMVKKSWDQAQWDLQALKNQVVYNSMFNFFFGKRIVEIDNVDTLKLYNPATGHRSLYISVGVGNEIRGRLHDGRRISKLILDDIESEKNTDTRDQRQKVRDFVYKNALPGLEPADGKVWFVGTITHYDSLLNNIRESHDKGDKTWDVVYSPAWKPADLFGDAAKSTFASRFSVQWLREKHDEYANQGMIGAFFQEWQNIPVADVERLFPEDLIRYHNWNYRWDEKSGGHVLYRQVEDEEEVKPVNLFMGVDPSVGKKDGDFSGFAVTAVDVDWQCYCLESYRKRVRIFEIMDEIWEKSDQYNHALDGIIVEEQNAFEWLRDPYYMRCQMENRYLNWRGAKVKRGEGEGDEGRGKKRLKTLSSKFKGKKLALRRSHADLIQEMLTYPKSAHDDAMDALWLSMHYDFLYPPSKSRLGRMGQKPLPPKFKAINWMTGAPL